MSERTPLSAPPAARAAIASRAAVAAEDNRAGAAASTEGRPAAAVGWDERAERVLERIAAHLESTDERGEVWADDITVVILKGHLIIEAELIDICGRLLKNPAALGGENMRFAFRLKLVRALVGDDEFPDAWWRAIEELNTIRNKLTHHLEPKDLETSITQFIQRFTDMNQEDKDKPMREQLIYCLMYLCGGLCDIGNVKNDG
jgi:hypothetical protein